MTAAVVSLAVLALVAVVFLVVQFVRQRRARRPRQISIVLTADVSRFTAAMRRAGEAVRQVSEKPNP